MTITDSTDRLTAHVCTLLVDVPCPSLIEVGWIDGYDGVTLRVPRAVSMYLPDPVALAARLRQLADELDARTVGVAS